MPELIYSPETKKRRDAEDKRLDEELKRDLDEITSESDEFDPTGKTPEQMDAMIAKYHMDCHNSRMEAIRRRDLLQGTCRSCTLPHLYSPGVCPAFAGLDPAPHVPRQIRPAEDWSVLVSGDGDPDVSRYNELERKRAAREHGPVKSVPQLRLSGPIRPAGPIPPLDTKLLVTSKVFLLLSESATVAYSVVLRQSSGPPRRRHRPAKVTAEPSKVQPPSLHARTVTMALRESCLCRPLSGPIHVDSSRSP